MCLTERTKFGHRAPLETSVGRLVDVLTRRSDRQLCVLREKRFTLQRRVQWFRKLLIFEIGQA